jgi:hypothetical protein
MKSVLSLPVLLIAAFLAPDDLQSQAWSAADEAGVVAAAMDYMDGALNADAERVARGVHMELNKVMIRTLPQTGRQVLAYNTHTTLVEAVRGIAARVADVDKTVDVTVFDIGNDLAVARAVGELWYDFLQLARVDGEWKIVNVLWGRNQLASGGGQNSEEERAGVEAAALDYIEGAYSGDADRMARAVHPELNKVLLARHRETGMRFLYKMGAGDLIEGTRAGLGLLDEEERQIEVEIYDLSHDIAQVKVVSAMYIDYLQLARVNEEWKIINVLWVPNPDQPGQ